MQPGRDRAEPQCYQGLNEPGGIAKSEEASESGQNRTASDLCVFAGFRLTNVQPSANRVGLSL